MITKPTVLVLGAGASMDYGYPSGAGLLENICRQIHSSEWIWVFRKKNISNEDIEQFRSDLILSQQPSVDMFLEHRPEFIDIGKLTMALCLMSYEEEAILIDFGIRKKSWYHHLLTSINTGFDEFGENKLSIITYNYDRSLEHFLFTSLKNTYNKSDEVIAEVVKKIPIIHVHGWLGPLPWEASGGRPYRRLDIHNNQNMNTIQEVESASNRIAIMSEEGKDTAEFKHASDLLYKAESIYFLGFGYHAANIERLNLGGLKIVDRSLRLDWPTFRPIYYSGTAMGLGKAQRDSIRDVWRIFLPDNSSDALNFLKEYARLD